ncbi:glycosyltransferase family 2 protein [Candidatus Peregrinibacteria bacterium]|nr:MAG: glycosyltransferase family 2 protein [Candidatus Peregrinibacteria bacterium]
MKISVVIPTYNRLKKLKICLQHLEKQSLNKAQYDIWVVDDGSTDETKTFLKSWIKKDRYALFQKNQGQGVARNAALKKLKGEITLFIGDDIYVQKDFLKKHYEFHEFHPELQEACLGLTEWDPNEEVTPFMHWMTHGGYQFAYDKLKENQKASFWHFYTSNLSLKTALLKKQNFNPSFKGYGWEDIEIAYRLEKEEGMSLRFTPAALAHHSHPLNENDLKRKMESLAKNGAVFEKLQPTIRVLPRGFKKLAFHLIGSRASLWILKFFKKISRKAQNGYWYALSKRYFLEASSLLK